MRTGRVISIWRCDNCHTEAEGSYYVDRYADYEDCVEAEEPDGWWVSSEEIFCGECRPL